MKELTIAYIPAENGAPPKVRVSYRPEPRARDKSHEADFHFTVTDDQRKLIQWYLEEYLIYPWGVFRKRALEAEALMVQLGEDLFRAVFCDSSMMALYAYITNTLSETDIYIHANHPEGISIPWELMHDPERGEYGDLARLARTFARSQPDVVFEPPPELKGDTFNILLVICRPGGPEGDIPFQSVARPLLELVRPYRDCINVDVLRPPTFERLGRALNEKPGFYHVLHFDGHGSFPQAHDIHQYYGQEGPQGLLQFGDRLVSGEELGGLLAGKGIPVVLLNACQSGMTLPECTYPSVGNQLLRSGARGVVAMAYSVYKDTAVQFMASLYEGLINGEELARAVHNAREALRNKPERKSPIGEVQLRDWIVPVLFQAAPVRVMKPRKNIHLKPTHLTGQQTEAGAEIGCPEKPALGFVGRDGVTLDLEQAFENETIVLLEGMAGVGKTEMAMAFARWRAETGALDGPIFFFRFTHYLPLAHICDSIGNYFNPIIRRELGEDWALLTANRRPMVAAELLKQIPCFLIWDNFEPVAGFPKGAKSDWTDEEQRELRDFLHRIHGGKTNVLLTSRRSEQWLGETYYHRVELRGLKLVEAQEYAVRVLRHAGVQQEKIQELPQYNDLLKYLNGNPLSLQVILPELKRTKPDSLLSALKTGTAAFTADDPSQGREHSLTASLTYRLDALDPLLRKRLGILALFQGFVEAQVLGMMCQKEGAPDLLGDLDREDWIRILDIAAEVGLLRSVGTGLYTLHPALPWFFHAVMEEIFSGEIEWFERTYSETYSSVGYDLFKLFNTNTQIAMTLLNSEEGNLLHALRLARRLELWEAVEGILYGLNQLLTTQGRWTEWMRLIEDLESDTSADGKPISGREDLWRALLGHRSEYAMYTREFEGAEKISLQLRDHYQAAGDDRNNAAALHMLGMIAQKRRQFDESEQWYRQSLEIEQRIGDEQGQAKTLHQLGNVACLQRQFDEAEQWYRQSLEIERRIGNEQGQAGTLYQLGMIAQERRQFDEAEQWHRQSLEIEQRIGDELGQAKTLHQLGMIAQERRQFDEAEQWYRQSLEIKRRIGNELSQAQTLHQLGNVAYLQRQFDEAEQWYRQSLEIKRRTGDELGQAAPSTSWGLSPKNGRTRKKRYGFMSRPKIFLSALMIPTT